MLLTKIREESQKLKEMSDLTCFHCDDHREELVEKGPKSQLSSALRVSFIYELILWV